MAFTKEQKIGAGITAITVGASLIGLALRAKAAPPEVCTPETIEIIDYCADGRTPKRVRKCQLDGTWKEELYMCPIVFSDVITIQGLDIPIYWTEETGKPTVGLEYRDAMRWIYAKGYDRESSYNWAQPKINYPDRPVSIPSGTWVIYTYPDGTKMETPWLSGMFVMENNLVKPLSGCIPAIVERPCEYKITSRLVCGIDTGFYDPKAFLIELYTAQRDAIGTETENYYLYTKTGSSPPSPWYGHSWGDYAKYFTPEELRKFLQYGFDDALYKNEIIALQTSGQEYAALEDLMNRVIEIKDACISSGADYALTDALQKWYSTYSMLLYFYGGYILP